MLKWLLMVLEFDGYCKISLRSDGKRDVSKISGLYGGGGHKGASGFNVNSSNPRVTCKEILDLLKR